MNSCQHPEEFRQFFEYGAPGYGGGVYCRRCGAVLEDWGGILTEEDVK